MVHAFIIHGTLYIHLNGKWLPIL